MGKIIKAIDLANKVANDELEDGFKILKDGNIVLVYNREDKIFTSERGNIEYIKFDYFSLNKEVEIIEEDKEIEKLEKLEKLIQFLDENNIELTSCSCCDGIGIEIDGLDISTMCICNKQDMYKLLNELKGK